MTVVSGIFTPCSQLCCSKVVENHTAAICRVTYFAECCNDVVKEHVFVT